MLASLMILNGGFLSITLGTILNRISLPNINATTWYGLNDINMLIMPLKEKKKLKVGFEIKKFNL